MCCYFIGAVNNFIQVRFDFIISTIVCIFSDEAMNTVKYCEIFYGPNAECDNASLISYASGEPSASQSVEISLSLHESEVTDNQDSFCYKVDKWDQHNHNIWDICDRYSHTEQGLYIV